MVTEQNKNDLIETLYRRGLNQTKGESLFIIKTIDLPDWDDEIFWETAQALIDEKLIRLGPQLYVAFFTLSGIKRAEALLNPPPSFTQNTVNASTVINSPIQQGGEHSVMTQSVNNYSREDLQNLVKTFEERIDELSLDPAARRKVLAQVGTIKSQLEDDPNPAIIKEAGRTLRNITEGVIGSLISAAVQPSIWVGIQHILAFFK